MAYKYICKNCREDFYTEQPNINQRCRTCGKYAFLDWGHRQDASSDSLE